MFWRWSLLIRISIRADSIPLNAATLKPMSHSAYSKTTLKRRRFYFSFNILSSSKRQRISHTENHSVDIQLSASCNSLDLQGFCGRIYLSN